MIMKYYTERDGLFFNAVFFIGDRIAAKTHIQGTDLGPLVEQMTNGEAEQIDSLPNDIWLRNGIISWKASTGKP